MERGRQDVERVGELTKKEITIERKTQEMIKEKERRRGQRWAI